MSMYEIEQAVKTYLDEEHLRYKHEDGRHAFLLGFELQCENMNQCTMAITAHDEEDLSCHVTYKENVPEYARSRVVEYITRANYGLFLGNFQLDMNDGQIIYQIGIAYSDHNITRAEIGRMVHVAAGMAERYGQGFYDVINGSATPEEAIEEAENTFSMADLPGRREETACYTAPDDPAGVDSGPVQRRSSEANDDYREMLVAMTEQQLDTLADAVAKEMGSRTGIEKDDVGEVPADYTAVVADLSAVELLELSFAVLDERFRRVQSETVSTETEKMSAAELRRRRASAALKEKLRERLFDDEREAV